MKVLSQVSVTTTLSVTNLLASKFLEVQVGNTDVLLAFGHKHTSSEDTDYMTLLAGKLYYFVAPKGRLFYWAFSKTASGTSTLTIVVSMSNWNDQSRYLVKTVDSSSARTTSASGNSIDLAHYRNVAIVVKLTAHGGTTPTMDIKIQGSDNNSDWSDLNVIDDPATALAFAQITVTDANYTLQCTINQRYLRIYWTLGGTTPSYTFSTVYTAKR